MKFYPPSFSKAPIKFRMPTSDNLVPIRLDIEVDGQRFKDAFTWNPTDPDSEVANFSKRTVKDLKLPPAFMTQITQSIQSQLADFRSYEGQDMQAIEKIVPLKLDLRVNNTVVRDQFLWDISNFENNPEEFARTMCEDLNIDDPEVAPAIAVSIREQLYELAVQNIASAKEYRMGKKGRRGPESVLSSKYGGVDVAKLLGTKGSVTRKRKEWHLYEPIVDILSNEEAEALDAREEQNSRLKKRLEDKEDSFHTH